MQVVTKKFLQPFLEKVYRRSKSEGTVGLYFSGTTRFCRWYGKEPEQVIRELKKGKFDIYNVLDNYVGYLSKLNKSPNTINAYLNSVKKFLRFYGIELSNEKLKEKIDMPRLHSITEDRIPSVEELKAILYSTSMRGKAMISMLASSGMRIAELLSLRVKDVTLATHPTRIKLSAEVTKDRLARICFLSDEATKLLKEYLRKRINEQDSYIFQARYRDPTGNVKLDSKRTLKNKPISYYTAEDIYTIAVKKAGMFEKDDHGRFVLHMHVLRKFFFTQMVSVLGREIPEALMGHKEFYDSAYRRFTEQQLGEYYLKGMHTVTILQSKQSESTNTDSITKEIASNVKNKMEDKAVDVDELTDYLNDGWNYVHELSNGKVIVRRS